MSALEMRQVGRSGLSVSVLGLGCNNFGRRLDARGTAQVVHAALDFGVTLFDTADVYGDGASEEFLGAALRGRRDRVVIATKFGATSSDERTEGGGASRRWIRIAVERSLRRLGTDWIDLYQMHFPDPDVPIDETLAALDELITSGVVRYIGSSNLSGGQIADAAWTSQHNHLAGFISAQNELNLLHREGQRDLTPACVRFGIGIIPYYPLAGGMLTGKYVRGEHPATGTRLDLEPEFAKQVLTDHNFRIVAKLEHFAQERGISLLSVVVGGLAAQPMVASVIAGAMSPDQLAANVSAVTWTPSIDDRAVLDQITNSTYP